MIFRSRETYIRANRIFSKMLLDETYSISLVASCVEVSGNFLDDRKSLYEENARIKATGSASVPCSVLPITRPTMPRICRSLKKRPLMENQFRFPGKVF